MFIAKSSPTTSLFPSNRPERIILSGSPFSVNETNAPDVDIQELIKRVPVLGVCYGAQLTAKRFGGVVEKSNKREYGRARLQQSKADVFWKMFLTRARCG